jgi:GxxExxY protein
MQVHYHGAVAGEYSTDPLVEGRLVVEPTTVKELGDVHRMQCSNDLKAPGLAFCLMLNLGKPRLEITRVVRGP